MNLDLHQPWSVPRVRSDEVVFVLGAGASKDAGLPLAKDLTAMLREQLVRSLPGFTEVLEAVARLSASAVDDYEELFWWLKTLFERARLRDLVGLDSDRYAQIYWQLNPLLRDIIVEHLWSQDVASDPSYLARIVDHAVDGRAIKVFTLNYDTCVERACRAHGLSVTTGFSGPDDRHRGWTPAVFERDETRGVHLYKLHGSLTWFGNDPDAFENLKPPDPRRPKHRHSARPTLILGPGDKVQTDDPYSWLLARFHESLKGARTCVVVGFGWRDLHVAQRIWHENALGLDVVDVSDNVTRGDVPRMRDHRPGAYRGLPMKASEALTSPAVAKAIADARQVVMR